MNRNVKVILMAGIITSGLVNIKYPYIPDTDNLVNQIHILNNGNKIVAMDKSKGSVNQNKVSSNQNIKNTSSSKSNTNNTSSITHTSNANDSNNINNTDDYQNKQQENSNQLSRGGNVNEIDITLTFYTSLSEENGGFKGINCSGRKLIPGMVANNVLPQGTKIYTKEFGTLTVADKGGDNFNTIHRLDVYVPRTAGESDEHYKKRVTSMGRVKVKGIILE